MGYRNLNKSFDTSKNMANIPVFKITINFKIAFKLVELEETYT